MGFIARQSDSENDEVWPEEKVGYGFDDYWWLRDWFIRMMLDIKGPIKGHWYNRNSVQAFIGLWGNQWIMKSVGVRLHQVEHLHDYARFKTLHQNAAKVKGLLGGSEELGMEDQKIVSEYLAEAANALASVDRWFKRKYWPETFELEGDKDEFEKMSIQTARMHAPFEE